jgi:hypothetical protein
MRLFRLVTEPSGLNPNIALLWKNRSLASKRFAISNLFYPSNSIFSPSLSTFVSMAISRPNDSMRPATSSRLRSVTMAMEGPTELMPTKLEPCFPQLRI